VIEKSAGLTLNQATIGAPAERRHMLQWHTVWWNGAPRAS
jgi:hypothetical protein